MDYLDPQKKQAHLIRLYIGYLLMAIAIGFGTWILVSLASGYDVDRKTGEVIQNGLMIVSAKPHAASIYLNGRQERSKTDARLTVPAGTYLVELKRAGYQDWRHQIALDGGSVERLTYPILFPKKLVMTNQLTLASMPRAANISPDRRYIFMQFDNQPDTFSVFDTTQPDKPPVALALARGILQNPEELGQLDFLEWSNDSRRILLANRLPSHVEYIMLDRQDPATSFSVNKLFSINPVKITLRDRKIDQFYALNSDGVLDSLDARNTPQANQVLSGVLDFTSSGANNLVYITADGAASGEVQMRYKDGDKTYALRGLPNSSSPYILALANYSNDWFMAVGTASEGKVYIYRDPDNYLHANPDKRFPVPVSVLKLDDPKFVTFSSDSSVISVQSGSKFAVYDNENNRQFQYQLSSVVPAAQKVLWMDGHHLCTVVGGASLVSDYDGANTAQLAPGVDSLGCFFDKNYLHMYSFAPGSASLTLTSTLLELTNEPSDNLFGF